MKKIVVALFCAFIVSAGLASEPQQLFSREFVSPYSDVRARLEIWGESGSTVQSYINYLYYASNPEEMNVLRVVSVNPITVRWFVSSPTQSSVLSQKYFELTGRSANFVPDQTIQAKLDMTFGSFSQSVASSSSDQSGEFIWDESNSGVFWGTWQFSFNVQDMIDYDASTGAALATGFGGALSSKKVGIQWIKGVSSAVDVSPLSVLGDRIVSTISVPSRPGSSGAGWRSVNVFEDGVFLPPSRFDFRSFTPVNGIQNAECSWSFVVDKRYQLQVVDLLGNSTSVWFPLKAIVK